MVRFGNARAAFVLAGLIGTALDSPAHAASYVVDTTWAPSTASAAGPRQRHPACCPFSPLA
jgi:hypothetical protein